MIPAHWEGPRRIADLEAKLAEAKMVIGVLDDMIDAALVLCDANDWCQECAVAPEIRRALAHRNVIL